MKVLIDLDRACAEGAIGPAERDRLRAMAGSQTSELAVNILIGFGIVAVTVGFVAVAGAVGGLLPPGLGLAAIGLGLILRGGPRWATLGQIGLVLGTALAVAGLVLLEDGSFRAVVAAALIATAAAIVAQNGLLAAAAVLLFSSALGASTSYEHARYTLVVEQPLLSATVFGLAAAALTAGATRLPGPYERLALIAARTAALLVCFALLVGSLWGDTVSGRKIPAVAFSIAWALLLVAVGYWAWRENRRWPLIAAAVFGAIHFYTQFFERIGANGFAIAAAGLIAVAIGYGLKTLLGTMPGSGGSGRAPAA